MKKKLAQLLHFANRIDWRKSDEFYRLKSFLLKKYGKKIGIDYQYLPPKMCYACRGTGEDIENSWYNEETKKYEYYLCSECTNGVYDPEVWVILERYEFEGFIFHQPLQKVWKKPEGIEEKKIIQGLIKHTSHKYSEISYYFLLAFLSQNVEVRKSYKLGFYHEVKRILGFYKTKAMIKWYLSKMPKISFSKKDYPVEENVEFDDLPF